MVVRFTANTWGKKGPLKGALVVILIKSTKNLLNRLLNQKQQ